MHPQHHPEPARRRRGYRGICVAVGLTALTGLSLAACGKDSDKASSTAATTVTTAAPSTAVSTAVSTAGSTAGSTAAPTPSSGDASADAATAVCTPYLAVSDQMSKDQPDAAALPALLKQLTAASPSELKDSLSVMVDAVNKVMASQGQDSSATESPAFGAAQTKVSNWMFDNCTFDAKVKVTTKDFEFDGLPATMKPGTTAFLVTNDGPESHEMSLNRKKASTTESWDDLLKLPEDQAQSKVDVLGGAFLAAVGSTSLVVVDLTPGDYAALCFVPMGTSMGSDGTMTEGTGAPHAMSGMVKEFTVAP